MVKFYKEAGFLLNIIWEDNFGVPLRILARVKGFYSRGQFDFAVKENTLPPGSIDFDVNKLREGCLCLNNIVFRRRYMS